MTAYQVENALRSAYQRGFDALVFAGFSFDAAARICGLLDELVYRRQPADAPPHGFDSAGSRDYHEREAATA